MQRKMRKKKLYGKFKRMTEVIIDEKIMGVVKQRIFKIDTDFLIE